MASSLAVVRVRRLVLGSVAVGCLSLLGVWLFFYQRERTGAEQGWSHRGRVAYVSRSADSETSSLPDGEGTQWVSVSPDSEVQQALDGLDDRALGPALEREGFDALAVVGHVSGALRVDATVLDRLYDFQPLRSVSGVYLAPELSIYQPAQPIELPEVLRQAMARVARGILSGDKAPQMTSFPEALRQRSEAELLIILREHHTARLWRSARGGSLARSLVMAATVARQRWHERETAMGRSLAEALPELSIEIAVLEPDGTLGDTNPSWLNRVIASAHGVGYEQRGSWHYQLPEETREAGGGAAAFARLLAQRHHEPSDLARPDVRAYRFVLNVLFQSASPSDDSAFDSAVRDEAIPPEAPL